MNLLARLLSVCMALACLTAGPPGAAAETLRLAVTTSVENSGLAAHVLKAFTKQTGIKVHRVVAGSGQALMLGRRGEVDALLVHAKPDELRFFAAGHASSRVEIMHNDFILVGPESDPAKVRKLAGIKAALMAIKQAKALFLSRGDDSGTHKMEIGLWQKAGGNPAGFSPTWYRRSGSGQGATLNIATGLGGYMLIDRATWLTHGNKRGMEILAKGRPPIRNQYGFLVISKQRHSHVNSQAAVSLRDWLVAPQGKAAIGGWKASGKLLFTPDRLRP